MKILVINTGSSSLKYQLIDMTDESLLAKGICERIGMSHSTLKHKKAGHEKIVVEKEMENHNVAMQIVIDTLTNTENGVIKDVSEISAVGHRVVHGGERFHDSVEIDEEVLDVIKDCIDLAPLHNPPNITGIEACRNLMPDIPMIAVFDTAFHQTIPQHAYLYALPYEIYKKYGIRKYGFHGTSHKYVSQRAASMLNKPIEELKMISCHLGNGASVCAIKGGKSMDTSMGFTPLAGLAMGTRSGTIDPAVISFLMQKEKMSIKEINDYLNKKSGMLGISGFSSDFRDLQEASEKGDERANLAISIFCYRVKKYIGEYATVMDGVDVVIVTAGIGENNGYVRERVFFGLDYMGIKIDVEKNKVKGQEIDISTPDSRVRVLVIPTNEELAIARETYKIVG